MNNDQKVLLFTSPIVFIIKCIGAIGTILRETPKELKETYKYLGDRK